MSKIAYFVHGRGRGHASRALDIVPALNADGHEVQVYAGADAYRALSDWPNLHEIEAVTPGRGMAASFRRRFQADRRVLREERPDLVVTDGDGPSMHAAASLGLRSLAIGHGIVFNDCELKGLPPLARRLEAFNAGSSSWLARRRVAVHFLPTRSRRSQTRVARPNPLHLPKDGANVPKEPYLLAYFRDKNGYGALERLAQRGFRVVCFGSEARDVGASVSFEDFDRQNFLAHLAHAKAVVGSAGSNLLAECVGLGLPIFALHRRNDREQSMNVKLLEDAHAGMGTPIDDPQRPIAPSLDTFADRLSANDFARIDLSGLQPVSQVTCEEIRAMER